MTSTLQKRRWATATGGCRLPVVLALAALFLAGALDANAWAGPWVPMTSAFPIPGNGIPTAQQVPGKDYSDYRDKDGITGAGDPEQVIAWDGMGGIRDSVDYSGSRLPFPGVDIDLEVDALAAGIDALYNEVIADNAALLFSVGDLGIGGLVGDGNIYVEPTAAAGGAGAFSIWATPTDIDQHGVTDVDGLEVWGADNVDDSTLYSLYGDPFAVLTPALVAKVAIWEFSGGASTPHTLTSELAAAMDLQFTGFGLGGPAWGQLVELMDLDAMMVLGREVLFSIAPIDLSQFDPLLPNLDGGEIFVYTDPNSPTSFLRHGGHEWDTAFDVMGTFNVLSENINALEAVSVPEPSSLVLALLAIAGLIGRPLWRTRRTA
ncbi:MAG: PEP-CTERM sorting domain-containing protein [Pirellulales bacterium]